MPATELQIDAAGLILLTDEWFIHVRKTFEWEFQNIGGYQRVVTHIHKGFEDSLFRHILEITRVAVYSKYSEVLGVPSSISGFVERYNRLPLIGEPIRIVANATRWFTVCAGHWDQINDPDIKDVWHPGLIISEFNIEEYHIHE